MSWGLDGCSGANVVEAFGYSSRQGTTGSNGLTMPLPPEAAIDADEPTGGLAGPVVLLCPGPYPK